MYYQHTTKNGERISAEKFKAITNGCTKEQAIEKLEKEGWTVCKSPFMLACFAMHLS